MTFRKRKNWINCLSEDERQESEDGRLETVEILTMKPFNHLSNTKSRILPFG